MIQQMMGHGKGAGMLEKKDVLSAKYSGYPGGFVVVLCLRKSGRMEVPYGETEMYQSR